MPRARTAKAWNQDLAAACDARLRQAQSTGSRDEFAWRDARDKINGMSQEIYVTLSTGNIVNLDKAVDPNKQHKIHRELEKPYCNEEMRPNYFNPGVRGLRGGWSSNKSLIKYNLLVQVGGGNTYNANVGGFQATKQTFMLNDPVATPFIAAMLEKWPTQRAGGSGGGGASPFGDAHFGGHGGRGGRGGGGHGGGGRQWSFGHSCAGKPAPPHKQNASDRAELEMWVRDPATSLGGIKDFNVCKDRRWYLHQVCAELEAREGFSLAHASSGTGHARTLSIRLDRGCGVGGSEGGDGLGSFGGLGGFDPEESPSFKNRWAPPHTPAARTPMSASGGHKLGGSRGSSEPPMSASASAAEARAKAASAAEARQAPPGAATPCAASAGATRTRPASTPVGHPTPAPRSRGKSSAAPWQSGGPARRGAPTPLGAVIELSDDEEHPEPPPPKRPRSQPAAPSRPSPYQPPPAVPARPIGGGMLQSDVDMIEEAELRRLEGHGCGPVHLDSDEDEDAQLAAALAASRASHAEEQRRQQSSCGARPSDSGSGGSPAASSAGSSRQAARGRPSDVQSEAVVVLVDERERQANSNPLSIYLNLRKALDEGRGVLGFPCEVRRQHLSLGDFGWALEGPSGELCVLPVLVERKRIGDLVGRSAQGDHIEQLRRMGDHMAHAAPSPHRLSTAPTPAVRSLPHCRLHPPPRRRAPSCYSRATLASPPASPPSGCRTRRLARPRTP